jgi:REP element-mobilizing transposase RayT
MKPKILWGRDTPGHRALRRGRFSEPYRVYFLTTCTHEGQPLLLGEVAQLMVESIFRWQLLCRFPLLAFVVMPDHVHVLGILTTPEPLSKVFGRWKNWSAREANKLLKREGRFWQPAFYDHAVRREENLIAIAAYIEANPVRAGLVESPDEFPYSSAFPSHAERLLGWRWLVGEKVFDTFM